MRPYTPEGLEGSGVRRQSQPFRQNEGAASAGRPRKPLGAQAPVVSAGGGQSTPCPIALVARMHTAQLTSRRSLSVQRASPPSPMAD